MFWQSGRAGHPSLPPRAAPHAGGERRRVARWLAAGALALAALVARGAAADPPPDTEPKPKASSYAPHHTRSHVYGTPVSKPIVHRQKKRAHRAAPAAASTEPIK
jgi:hypothetical protein